MLVLSLLFVSIISAHVRKRYSLGYSVRLHSLEKILMLGKFEGSRRRRQQRIDGWMASLTRWTWVWASSRSRWCTGRPGMLESMGSQTVRHDWATEFTDCVSTPHITPSTLWGSYKWCCYSHSFFMFWPCRAACRVSVPDQGLNSHSLQWKHGVLTTGLPGKSLLCSSLISLLEKYLPISVDL